MAQHDMILDNTPGLTFRSDANAALMALATVSSGNIEPASPKPGMLWLDTSVVPNGALRQRNQANAAWIPLQLAEAPQITAVSPGVVVTTGNQVYTGTDVNNATFPIGTTLLVKHTATAVRNSAIAPKLSATTGWFELTTGTALGGSWRARGTWGAASDWIILAERVS